MIQIQIQETVVLIAKLSQDGLVLALDLINVLQIASAETESLKLQLKIVMMTTKLQMMDAQVHA